MRFSIRDLILVTVIVAVATGWWISDRRRMQEIQVLEAKLAEAQARQALLNMEVKVQEALVAQQRDLAEGYVKLAKELAKQIPVQLSDK